MTFLYRTPSGEFPRYVGDVQREHPEWDEDDPLPDGWVAIEDSPGPPAIFNATEDEEGTENRSRWWVSTITHALTAEFSEETETWGLVWTASEPILLDPPVRLAQYIDGEWVDPVAPDSYVPPAGPDEVS